VSEKPQASEKSKAQASEKPKAKEKATRGAWQYYKIDAEKGEISRLKKKCPRCGGFMALHVQGKKRYYCGHCYYTEYV